MDLLKRNHAPITPEAWKQIDDEAKRVLQLNLAGRKLVDFDGPHGWQYSAVNTGHLTIRTDSGLGVPWGVRGVVPVIEIRVPFELPMMELDNASRGAVLDLPAVVSVAEKAAHAEDTAVFNGFKAGGIEGIIPSSPHPAITIPDDYADYPSIVVDAVETLRRGGINGPYALALGPGCYAGLAQAAEDGYPIRERVEHFLDGPMVLAPKVDGAVLLSHRGGDFQLSVGQDLSIGYAGHDKEKVYLYLTESFAFRVLERGAAVYLKPKRGKK
ncbi:MAG TPA: family 1 encapsulin nanocompartment shell protein [Anaerolineae bacterium]|nr:family 1 encapsulin nanocompartment shell protein [Anaerolineae bacterium]